MEKRRRVTSAFKWQIPFCDYVDANGDLQVLDEGDVIRGILA